MLQKMGGEKLNISSIIIQMTKVREIEIKDRYNASSSISDDKYRINIMNATKIELSTNK